MRDYVLKDPDNDIYIQPDGQPTCDKKKAKLFKDPDEAKKFRDGHKGIPYFEPEKYDDP